MSIWPLILKNKTCFKKVQRLEFRVNNSKLLASSKKKLGLLLKKQFFYFFILYFQIMALPLNGPSYFFGEPSFFLFEETKFDLYWVECWVLFGCMLCCSKWIALCCLVRMNVDGWVVRKIYAPPYTTNL